MPERDRVDAAAVPAIHAVTNDAVLAAPGFPALAERVMRALGNRGALHLRAADMSAARMFGLAQELQPMALACGALLVVNDRPDLALAAGLSAVQLTSRSVSVTDARRMAPRLRIGASVHDVAAARLAASESADWVVAGHVFVTPSHAGETARGMEFVRMLAPVGVPVIAIGGIRPEHVAGLRAAGAAGVAVIRGIWGSDDAEGAATDYLRSYDADPDD